MIKATVWTPFFQSGDAVVEKYKGRFSSLSQLSRFNSSLSAVTYQLEYVPHTCCWTNAVLDQTVCWSRLVWRGRLSVGMIFHILLHSVYNEQSVSLSLWQCKDSFWQPMNFSWHENQSVSLLLSSSAHDETKTEIKPLIWKETITPQLLHCYLLSIVSSSLTGYLPEKNAVTVRT